MENISIEKKIVQINLIIPILAVCFSFMICLLLYILLKEFVITIILFIIILITTIFWYSYCNNIKFIFNKNFFIIKTLFNEKKILNNTIKINKIRKINLEDERYNFDYIEGKSIIHIGKQIDYPKKKKTLIYMTNRKKCIIIPTLEFDIIISIDVDENEINKIINVLDI